MTYGFVFKIMIARGGGAYYEVETFVGRRKDLSLVRTADQGTIAGDENWCSALTPSARNDSSVAMFQFVQPLNDAHNQYLQLAQKAIAIYHLTLFLERTLPAQHNSC